jgi:hypothetical protein
MKLTTYKFHFEVGLLMVIDVLLRISTLNFLRYHFRRTFWRNLEEFNNLAADIPHILAASIEQRGELFHLAGELYNAQ